VHQNNLKKKPLPSCSYPDQGHWSWSQSMPNKHTKWRRGTPARSAEWIVPVIAIQSFLNYVAAWHLLPSFLPSRFPSTFFHLCYTVTRQGCLAGQFHQSFIHLFSKRVIQQAINNTDQPVRFSSSALIATSWQVLYSAHHTSGSRGLQWNSMAVVAPRTEVNYHTSTTMSHTDHSISIHANAGVASKPW
jgi:hypothetical protein